LRLKDLLNKGDASANVALKPGDTISIPESRF
ncbi:MAG: polysaccharide export protein, partial [Pseudomonadota bacterium]